MVRRDSSRDYKKPKRRFAGNDFPQLAIKKEIEKLGFEIKKLINDLLKESIFGVYKGPIFKQAHPSPREVHIRELVSRALPSPDNWLKRL